MGKVFLWVPFVEIEWLERGDGVFWRLWSDGLTVCEEATADYRAVLRGLTVAVEEVGFKGF